MNSDESIINGYIKQEPDGEQEQTASIQNGLRNDDTFTDTITAELVTCKLEYDDSIEIKEEIITTSDDEEREEPCYTCDNCNYETEDHRSFKLHMNTCNIRPSAKPIRDLRCNVCLRSFTSECRFSRHFREHSDGSFNKRRVQKKDKNECKICHKEFRSRHGLKNHLTIHTGEKKYRCTMCPKVFRTSSARCQHITIHMLDGKVADLYDMRYCRKRTSDEKSLDAKKKFKCTICSKQFRVAKYLAIHKTIHTMKKMYNCKICGKAFRWNSSLQYHRRTHERKINNDDKENKKMTKNKPRVECTICHKTYAHKLSLRQHMIVHDEDKLFECSLCHNKFTRSASLRYHYTTQHLLPPRRVITSKPYECSLCPKSYGQSCHLNRHMKSHEGARVECPLCEKTFTEQWSLKRHMGTMHDVAE